MKERLLNITKSLPIRYKRRLVILKYQHSRKETSEPLEAVKEINGFIDTLPEPLKYGSQEKMFKDIIMMT